MNNSSQASFIKTVSLTFLILFSCSLGYAIYYLQTITLDITPSLHLLKQIPQNNSVLAKPQFAFKKTTLNSNSEINKRPIFNKNRKPYIKKIIKPIEKPIPQIKQEPSIISHTQLKLLGILINVSARKALISSPQNPKGLWYSNKMTIEGWRIISIHNDKVTIEGDGKKNELVLYKTNITN